MCYLGADSDGPKMDDSFQRPIPFPGGTASALPRMPDIPFDAEGLAACARTLHKPGRVLTLLSVDGVVLQDERLPRGADWSASWPDGSQQLILGAVAYARAGRDVMFEAMAPRTGPARALAWWRVHLAPVLTLDGTAIQFLMAEAQDLSGRMDQKHRIARPDWLPGISPPGPGRALARHVSAWLAVGAGRAQARPTDVQDRGGRAVGRALARPPTPRAPDRGPRGPAR